MHDFITRRRALFTVVSSEGFQLQKFPVSFDLEQNYCKVENGWISQSLILEEWEEN